MSLMVHGFLSSQLTVLLGKAHFPATHWLSVHGLASEQSVATLQLPPQPTFGAKTQLASPGLHESLVQLSPSSHTLAVPAWQLPPPHLSLLVQLLPSSHAAVLATAVQLPLAASQPSVVQGLLSLHTLAVPALHALAAQTSPWVQALPSLHGALLATLAQAPLRGSQLSLVQGLASSQLLALPALHALPAQKSLRVQALPSLHAAVFALVWHAPLTGLHASVVHGLPSLQSVALPALHPPPPHTSPAVQALPSSQTEVLGACTHAPVCGSQESLVQGLPSLQPLAAPGLQAPPLQASPRVQALLSLQLAVLAGNAHLPLTQASSVQTLLSLQSPALAQLPPQPVIGLNTQLPLAESHASLVHVSLSAQTLAAPALHDPPLHASPTLHASPSLHCAALALLLHAAVAGSHVSVVHGLLSLHVLAVPLWQEPPPHTSPSLHALPSLHGALLLLWLHPPVLGSHASLVQALPSSHATALPPTQLPPWQASPLVQGLPSLHAALLGVAEQLPLAVSQPSWVQGFASLQTLAAPGLHTPPPHKSPWVQALLSEHASVELACWQAPALQLSAVQGWPSSQFLALPGLQPPASH
jgi:hypothetical protein